MAINRMKRNVQILLNCFQQGLQRLRRTETLQIRFLINIPVLRPPPMNGMRRFLSIHSRLRIHRQKPAKIQVHQIITDGFDFGGDGRIAPREIFEVTADIFSKEGTNFTDGGREAPPSMGFGGGAFEADPVEVELAVGG